jgi:hypothetical protein
MQIPASYTKRTITLTNSSPTPYGPHAARQHDHPQFPSGNRYVNSTVSRFRPSAATVQATFRSEFASDSANGLVYNDPPGSVIHLVTSLFPGRDRHQSAPTFSVVAQAGSGLGTVTPSGTPASFRTASRCASTLPATSGATSVVDQRRQRRLGRAVGRDGAVLGDGITVTLADNGGNPAFVLRAPSTTSQRRARHHQVGADIETPQALGTRCRGLWPSLAFAKDADGNWIPTRPTVSAYVALALSANGQVASPSSSTDGTVNNKLNIIIAGQGGAPLSPPTSSRTCSRSSTPTRC